MNYREFAFLAPRCIVCDAPMLCQTFGIPSSHISFTAPNHSLKSVCSTQYSCFEYTSNVLKNEHDVFIERFIIRADEVFVDCVYSAPRTLISIVGMHNTIRLPLIPIESWIASKGKIREKIDKILLLA